MDRSGARVMPDNREIAELSVPPRRKSAEVDLRPAQRVIRVDRLRLVTGNPVMTIRSFFPARFPGLDRQSTALPTALRLL